MLDRSHLVTRRSFLAGVALLTVAAAHRIVAATAQEATPAAVATPSAGSSIRPTQI